MSTDAKQKCDRQLTDTQSTCEYDRLKDQKDRLIAQHEADLKEQGEQAFIQRFLDELAEHIGLETGDWDCEDDPAEWLAITLAGLIKRSKKGKR